VTLPFTLASMLLILWRHRITVVNVHFPSAMFGYLAICRRLLPRLRLVVSIHGRDLLDPYGELRFMNWLARYLLNSADAIVSPSAGFAAQCAPVLGKAPAPTVILNGSDLADGVQRGVAREAATLLAVASLDHWKGLDVLLRAVALLHEDFPALRLELAGEGPERGALEALARSLGIADSVVFAGFLDRMSLTRSLERCTAFVLPSRSEPFGIAVVEALAAGAPVVASRVGGIPEIITDGHNGLLVPPENPAALADALRTILSAPDLRSRLSEAGPVRAGELPWTRMSDQYLDLFRRVMAPPDSAARGGVDRGAGGGPISPT
jgi:glycosyltransferase involved in cell wall biosynthesis